MTFIACSPNSIEAKEHAEAARHNNYPVLITGPTGVGKELLAKLTHREGPYVVIDCTNLPKDLAERELFGHVKGAFTGASASSPGLIQAAHGGTAFFDEIGELPLDIQSKLLRLTQEGTYRPVGSSVEQTSHFRIVCATNRHLKTEVAQRRFREDLFYRLNIIRIEVKPLRERPEDLRALINIYADKYGLTFKSSVIESMMDYPWPGNVRELESLCIRLAANYGSRNQSLGREHLPPTILSQTDQGMAAVLLTQIVDSTIELVGDASHRSSKTDEIVGAGILPSSLRKLDDGAIRLSYERCGKDPNKLAKVLNISRSTVYRRLKSIKP